jgi:hypothetical protein
MATVGFDTVSFSMLGRVTGVSGGNLSGSFATSHGPR